MALFAQVGPVEADIQGDVAAKPALVIDELSAMARLLAFHLADADLLGEALLASEVLLRNADLLAHYLVAVIHPTEVRPVALLAHVERARCDSQALKVLKELVSGVGQTA